MDQINLTPAESLRLASCVATAMIHFFGAICSYYLERRSGNRPMFALIFLIVGWCTLTLGASISGVGRFFPAILVGAPFFSGYLGPSLLIYTRQLTSPHRPMDIRWLLLGVFGTIHSILALTIPNGLDPAIRSIIHKEPYWHPLLSSIMIIHGIQLIGCIVLSTGFITHAFWKKSRPDLRRNQFWLLIICWTCVITMVFTNILPTFGIIITDIEPVLFIFPIAVIGILMH
jgi:hypothetical protein